MQWIIIHTVLTPSYEGDVMLKYELKGTVYTIEELSDMSGIAAPTLRDRLRRGYSIEEAIKPIPTSDSVLEFCNDSWYQDWIGMSISKLYEIYWKWCMVHDYIPIHKQHFSRQIKTMFPIKIVSTKRQDGCHRIIRLAHEVK